jgi:hypothetical protein
LQEVWRKQAVQQQFVVRRKYEEDTAYQIKQDIPRRSKHQKLTQAVAGFAIEQLNFQPS